MALTEAIRAALVGLGLEPRVAAPLDGGSFAVWLVEAANGERVVVKAASDAPPDLFAREADGLRLLRTVVDAPRAPQPLVVGVTFLVLEYLESSPRAPRAWVDFAHGLAALHAHVGPAFGAVADNYLGRSPQSNTTTEDGHRFFADERLAPQLAWARSRGWLTEADIAAADRLMQRLPDLIPAQPASLIHGDLWSGNVIPGPGGALCLIDPAAHFGWAEADLAMTSLFGGFPDGFYDAYVSARPLVPGWRDRVPLYNLYHLLNHLNLFGAAYRSEVQSILKRYGGLTR